MKKFRIIFIFVLCFSLIVMSGCASASMALKELNSKFKGLDMVIRTFDEESQVIDRIEGNSINVSADNKFAVTDSEGSTVQKSGVVSVTVGGKSMVHVGSSMITAEKGLQDIFEEYTKTVDIKNTDSSVPILNDMINKFKNMTTGKERILLIRSQSGKPLAAYAGTISYFSTDLDKATIFLVDGMFLLVYRCDYTMYETALIKS